MFTKLITENLATIKAWIASSGTQAMKDASDARNDTLLAQLLNADSDFVVWKTNARKAEIFTAITWKYLLPLDVVPTDNALNVAIWHARSLACQGRQFNLQTMLISPGESLDMSDTQIKQGLQEALQNLPSGTGGADQDAGWAAVKAVGTRPAKVVEKVFATGTGTQAVPGKLVYEGQISISEVSSMQNA